MSYQLRVALPRDTERISELFPRLADFELPPQRNPADLWQGDLEVLQRWRNGELPDCFVYVAEDATGVILGAAMAQLRDELLSHAPSAHLEVLVVRDGSERQGIGGALVQAIEQASRARGATSITLHVFRNNSRARALYARNGFDEELIRAIKFLD